LDCADLDPRQANTISADDEAVVADGVRILADQLESARAGRPHASLDCPQFGNVPQASAGECLMSFAQLDLGHVLSVSRCENLPAGAARCVEMYVSGMSVRFVSASITEAPSRIVLEPEIVFADQRID
jgi:hypothetical protein